MAPDLPPGIGYADSEPGMPGSQSPVPPESSAPRTGWTAGRVISLAAGSVLLLVSLVLLGGAGILTWADQEQQGGYLSTGTGTYSTDGYALASNPVRLHDGWGWLGQIAGDVQIRVAAVSPAKPVFVAIGPAGDVSRYLAGVSYASVTAFGDHLVTHHPGNAVPAPPATAVDWAARAQGTGTQTLRWMVRTGDWMVVVMNPVGSPGVTVRTDMGVSSPVLPSLAAELLGAGLMTGLVGAALIVIPVRLAASRR